MPRNIRNQKVPKPLLGAKDARALFGYFFRNAALNPENGMRPLRGPVRRVVLFTRGFNDGMVVLLERLPNLTELTEGLQELRLVMTGITERGVDRLRQLMPHVEINVVTRDQWHSNVNLGSPEFNVETGRTDMAATASENTSESDLEEHFRKRYGAEDSIELPGEE